MRRHAILSDGLCLINYVTDIYNLIRLQIYKIFFSDEYKFILLTSPFELETKFGLTSHIRIAACLYTFIFHLYYFNLVNTEIIALG